MAPLLRRSLPEELVEEVLLRFPPDEPARLVHAALVCKRWHAIILSGAGAGFRRRFREFHRTPPLLGFVSNFIIDGDFAAEFVPTCSFPASRRVHSCRGYGNVCVADAHHGRVLLYRIPDVGSPREDLRLRHVFMVWDPTTDEQQEVPMPDVAHYSLEWTAALLCAANGHNHLDCRRGPFLIIFVAYDETHSETILCTYSSSTASWSKPVSNNQLPFSRDFEFMDQAAHVRSALYFGVMMSDHILKLDLESQEFSWIQLPTACSRDSSYVLTTTESGGLGVAAIHESSKLYMWSRNDVSEVDGVWIQSKVIELKTLLPVHVVLFSPTLLGFTVGTGVVFVMSNNVLFVIDLKTYKVIKEVSDASMIYSIIPYMSFFTPGT